VLDRIQASFDALSRSEQRVASLVLKSHETLSRMSIGDIALASNVSKPTVVRFCRSLGYQGFSDFKRCMVRVNSTGGGVHLIHRSVSEEERTSDMMLKLVDAAIASLINYRKDASSYSMELAIEAICGAHFSRGRVLFFGIGNSCVVARDARHKFLRLGLATLMFDDGHEQLMGASLCRENDVVIIFSNSGRTKDMLEVASIARRTGARVVSVTASGSPLESVSDILLRADHNDGFDKYLPTASRLLHLMVVDVLAVGVALKIGVSGLKERLSGIQGILIAKRYA
jgi:RpiR family transcriptional regulator, carbohydrate utilization regulator